MYRDQSIFKLIQKERERQEEGLELIASENFVSDQVMSAMGSILTNKYAEGYPRKRYYGGCEVVDQIEQLAIDRAKELYGASYANVQPHSGSQANMAIYLSVLKPGDKILGFDLSHGGHLTHGSPVSVSGILYTACFYGVSKDTGMLDYDTILKIAKNERPKIIIAGASAYSRDIDFKKFRTIADQVGALLMADISHPSGIIATGLLNDPIPHCHFVTTTTHKTLRGPRGGLILMGKDFNNPFGITWKNGNFKKMSTLLNNSVFPGVQGGPLEHVIAAKAVAFGEALEPSFKKYQQRVKSNARAMAQAFIDLDYKVISGGTDNHMLLIDLRNKGITGKNAEIALGKAGITVNKNMVPFDNQSPLITSGLRIGVPAVTTRGLEKGHMETIVKWINTVLINSENIIILHKVKKEINQLMSDFPLFKE